jgi:Arylsulfotransferase (ASST)
MDPSRHNKQELVGNSVNNHAAGRASRRAVLRDGLVAAGLGLLAPSDGGILPVHAGTTSPSVRWSARSSSVIQKDVAVFPLHDSRTASAGTEITLRLAELDTLGQITVVGSQSGAHAGIVAPHSDGRGVSFLPDAPFQPGESVNVRADRPLGSSADGSVTFNVAHTVALPKLADTREAGDKKTEPQTFRSRSDLLAPSITVTDPATSSAPGFIFVGPRTPDRQSGPMILDNTGELVWFLPLAGEVVTATDFRVQDYLGRPVLTYWEGVSGWGLAYGEYVLRDDTYREIARLRVGNGYYGGDLHEFQLTPQSTALISIYNKVRWDLTSIGGPEDGIVTEGIVQELDIVTGRVLFEWHSLDHIDLDESYRDPPSGADDAYDYFHLNSIELDHDDNLIISARYTWAAYKIDHRSGEVLWRLNGKRSSFTMGQGTATAFQHDARVLPNSRLSMFDNATDSSDSGIASRGVVLEIDTDAMTATLVHEYVHPDKIVSRSQGNMQMLPNDNAFVGWGSYRAFSEFDPEGTFRFNGRFQPGVTSYRAYRFPWVGRPSDAPAIAVELGSGTEATIYASWNGATEVATWQVLAGQDPDQMQPVGDAPRSGFETAITVQTKVPYLAVQAQDSSGNVLGVSEAVQASS